MTIISRWATMGNMRTETQKQIAQWCGLREPFLSQIFNGRKRPSAMRAAELEEITGVSLRDWLLLPHDELKRKVIVAYRVQCFQKKK